MDLPEKLRTFQANEPGFPPIFAQAADEIERLLAALEEIGVLAAKDQDTQDQIGKIVKRALTAAKCTGG